jgi:hypothetical protein
VKRTGQEKTMPLWAIWLITVLAVLAWCSVNGEAPRADSVRADIRAMRWLGGRIAMIDALMKDGQEAAA